VDKFYQFVSVVTINTQNWHCHEKNVARELLNTFQLGFLSRRLSATYKAAEPIGPTGPRPGQLLAPVGRVGLYIWSGRHLRGGEELARPTFGTFRRLWLHWLHMMSYIWRFAIIPEFRIYDVSLQCGVKFRIPV
jgi:hypothetical protein